MGMEKITFNFHKFIIGVYARMMLNYNLLVEEPLPDGPKIIVANHPTTTDPFLLPLIVKEPIYMLITEMAFEVPIFSNLLAGAGHIPVSKNRPGEHIVDQAVARLAGGGTVGLFPEGSLSPAIGKFCKARTGAARIAIKSGASVIPVGIHLSADAFFSQELKTAHYENTARWAYRGDYYLTTGKPLIFQGSVDDREYVRQVSDQLMNAITIQAKRSAQRMASKPIQWQSLLSRLPAQNIF